jgi:cytochrome c2
MKEERCSYCDRITICNICHGLNKGVNNLAFNLEDFKYGTIEQFNYIKALEKSLLNKDIMINNLKKELENIKE